jgi:transcription elongation factor GreA
MSSIKEIYLTNEGLEALRKELDYLKNEKRAEVIQALKEARSLGDLSENAEYDAARNEQAIVESKIQELEVMIENAKVIAEVKTDKVAIGTSVKIKYVEDGETEVYSIVGSKEADPFSNKISNESPIAQAIMGHKAGSIVTVASPNGKYDVEILEIS